MGAVRFIQEHLKDCELIFLTCGKSFAIRFSNEVREKKLSCLQQNYLMLTLIQVAVVMGGIPDVPVN